MKTRNLLSLGALMVSFLTASAEVVEYTIDPVHSGINFKIRNFVSKVPGAFTEFEGKIHYDKENPANSKVTASINAGSVDTRNQKRDGHLANEDFFDIAKFPTIEFSSTEWTKTGDGTYIVTGTLTMLGVDKPVELEVSFLGEMQARRNTVSGWEVKTVLDRSDWGMTYGSPATSLEVEVEINIQARR